MDWRDWPMSALDGYVPNAPTDRDAWARVQPAVAAVLDAVADDLAARARRATVAVALYADRHGHDVTADLLLRDELWAMWLAAEVTPASAPTYRSALRALAGAHGVALSGATGVLSRPVREKRVYSTGEVAAMLEHAARLPTVLSRRRAAAVVLCGVGAGLDGFDLSDMGPEAFRWSGGLLLVDAVGNRQTRTVAVLERYADALADVVAETPNGELLIGSPGSKTVTDRALRHFKDWGGVRVTARDLRRTYISTLYHARVPVEMICRQAGLASFQALDELLDLDAVDLDLACRMAASALPSIPTSHGEDAGG